MFEGFKKFIARGNMIDMAVGVVMGGAVTTVVNAIVNSVINPFIAMIFGKPNMDGLLAITFNGATVSFGAVLGAILNFLIIAVAVYFCILVPINKFRDMTEALLAKTKLAEQKEAEEKAEEMKGLLTFVKESLGDQVKEVKLSADLGSHPACMTPDSGMSFEMEKAYNPFSSFSPLSPSLLCPHPSPPVFCKRRVGCGKVYGTC